MEHQLGGQVPPGSFVEIWAKFGRMSGLDSSRQMLVEITRFALDHAQKDNNTILSALKDHVEMLKEAEKLLLQE